MAARPILYASFPSSCSMRVRTALRLKGIDYDYRHVNVVKKEGTNAEELRRLNPSAKVPVFVHEGHAISESLAIIEYIDEVFPQGESLLPRDHFRRAQARAIALHIACSCQPIQNMRVIKYVEAEGEGKVTEWCTHWLSVGLSELEELVKQSAGRFCVGDSVTIADLCLPSILNNARRRADSLYLSRFPTLLRIEAELLRIPAFKAAAEPEEKPKARL